MISRVDHRFGCMGGEMRLLLEGSDALGLERLAAAAVAQLREADLALSRFRDESELCALNRDSRTTVPASELLCAAVAAARSAAQRSGGLVDPTLLGRLERAGYAGSRATAGPGSLAPALRAAPRRALARPHPSASWRRIHVDRTARTVSRPPGARLDTGGTTKGLMADRVGATLGGVGRFAVDCGGDLCVGGADGQVQSIDVVHPLTGRIAHRIELVRGGVASSGLDRRLWTGDDGPAHHLIDPAGGGPAWTGLVGVTAAAPSALEAETLAKAALLSGPVAGRGWLSGGGVLFHDDGRSTVIEPRLRTTPDELARYAA